jgi:hypothetical protein
LWKFAKRPEKVMKIRKGEKLELLPVCKLRKKAGIYG